MCGISGFNFEDRALIHKMLDLLEHRGPNDSGFFIDHNLSLGMRRLSVLDLNTGKQPQFNENNSICVFNNGEIYNYKELRKELKTKKHRFYTNSDTEVIVHSYEEWGEDFISKLKGVFAFCIYDSNKKLLLLGRDRMGIKPLYYYYDKRSRKFIFASEIKSILLHKLHKKLDLESFYLYLTFRYIPSQKTLFKGIFKLPPSTCLYFDLNTNTYSLKKYYSLPFPNELLDDENKIALKLKEILEESVKSRLISDVPLGAFLSGGIDSSIIVGLMEKYSHQQVKTFSISFEKGAPVNESRYAKIVAEYFNTDHKELLIESTCYEIIPKLIWHLDDLISDPAVIPVYYLAQQAKSKITVALTGDGSDEIFMGYSKQYWLNRENWFKFLPNKSFKLIKQFYNIIPSLRIQMLLKELYYLKSRADLFFRPLLYLKDIEKNEIIKFKTKPATEYIRNAYYNNLDLINKYVFFDLTYQLPNFYNMKTDKMTMANSLEARIPFLDQQLVEYSAKISPNLKYNNNIEKYILRKAMRTLLPREILKRRKLGFGTPINLWYKTGMDEISDNILENLKNRKKIVDSDYINKLIKKKKLNLIQERIWTLIFFELWYETFIERDGLKPITFSNY